MSKTIILLDTNILVRRPFLDSPEWTDLSDRSDMWHLRFLVPDVVLMETVNVVRRGWMPDKRRLEQLSSWIHELGMGKALESILVSADDRAATYEASLRDRLADLGVEIESLPATIDHLDIARRASERRAPYGVTGEGEDAKTKDGYRDTLIWFCVLNVAQKHPGCDVWFVSNNFKDFGAKPTSKDTSDTADYPLDWHSELVRELDSMGLSGRVFYARSLRRLEQHLLAKFSPLSDAERDSLWGAVDRSEVDDHFLQALLSTALDPRSAALPLDTMTARISSSVRSSESVTLSEAAYRAGGAWTARFSCEVDAGVEVSRRSGDVETVSKPLIVTGRIEVTAESKVTALTVESIEAKPDDPQHRAWERLDETASLRKQMDKILDQMNGAIFGPSDQMDRIREQMNRTIFGPSDQMDRIREQMNRTIFGPSDQMDRIREQMNRTILGPHQPNDLTTSINDDTPDAEDPDSSDDHTKPEE